jgi:hypothetical protein
VKIRLDAWLARQFDPPPVIGTARIWIRQGKIWPAPIKVGRAYYVEENATFQDANLRPTLAQRIPK